MAALSESPRPLLHRPRIEVPRRGHSGRAALRELRRLGVRTWRRGVTTPPDARGLDALSARERQVASLVLAGERNADIARELFLSLKTIDSHTRAASTRNSA